MTTHMTIPEIIGALETAPRIGNDNDEPEGVRYIQISVTLADRMSNALRKCVYKQGE